MRGTLFRGKRKEYGEWVHGYLIGDDVIVGNIVEFNDEYFNTAYWYKVRPETVGQFTGLKDESGKEIFEGDQLGAPGNLSDDLQYVGDVQWDVDDARWEVVSFHGRFEYIPNGCLVIGNIHERNHLVQRAIETTESTQAE